MVQVFLILLTAVTFVLMAADPRPTDSAEAKSAWTEKVKTPIVSQVNKAGVAGEIVCSAEDREAQLCQ
jgi:ABC-type phosphate/phosphonate transport system substrate-binding protein